jgi:hypothetical protein
MAIVKMNRAQLADHLQKLWSAHEGAVKARLEAHDVKVLDKLAKAMNMPRHVRIALDWGYTRAMIGSGELGQSPEVIARSAAYDAAEGHVKASLKAWRSTGIYDYSENRRRAVKFEGACAGYLFAANERFGQ